MIQNSLEQNTNWHINETSFWRHQCTYVHVRTRSPWNSMAIKRMRKQCIPGALSPPSPLLLPLFCAWAPRLYFFYRERGLASLGVELLRGWRWSCSTKTTGRVLKAVSKIVAKGHYISTALIGKQGAHNTCFTSIALSFRGSKFSWIVIFWRFWFCESACACHTCNIMMLMAYKPNTHCHPVILCLRSQLSAHQCLLWTYLLERVP